MTRHVANFLKRPFPKLLLSKDVSKVLAVSKQINLSALHAMENIKPKDKWIFVEEDSDFKKSSSPDSVLSTKDSIETTSKDSNQRVSKRDNSNLTSPSLYPKIGIDSNIISQTTDDLDDLLSSLPYDCKYKVKDATLQKCVTFNRKKRKGSDVLKELCGIKSQ